MPTAGATADRQGVQRDKVARPGNRMGSQFPCRAGPRRSKDRGDQQELQPALEQHHVPARQPPTAPVHGAHHRGQ